MNRLLPVSILALGIAALLLSNQFLKPEATGEAMVSIVVPEFDAREQAGLVLFQENCAACHGDNAVGKEGFGPPLVHNIYKPSHHPDVAFELAAKTGVRSHHWSFGSMPAVPGINENDIAAIVRYVRKLQVANGIE